MATTYTEKNYVGDWLKREVDPEYSREVVTIAAGAGNLPSGAVVGKVTATGKYTWYDNTDAGAGNDAAAGILLEPVDATTEDKAAVILARGPAVVNKASLTWSPNNDANAILSGVQDLGSLNPPIIAREGN